MQEPLEIVFHNLEPTPALEAEIRDRFAKLERLYDRMTSCRVSVEALHKQHKTGNVYEVHIDMLVPRGELVVSKEPHRAKERYAAPDVHTSIKDAFKAAERQLIEHKRQIKENVSAHAQDSLFQGQVAEMQPERDFGYLLTNSGALLYFNRTAVLNSSFDDLKMGDVVHYVQGDGETGPVAAKVWRGPEHDLDKMR